MPRALLTLLLAAVLAAPRAAAAEPIAEGYALPYHLAPGETVRLHVRSSEAYQIRIWREESARILVHESPVLPAATPATNANPWSEGAGWPAVYELEVPAAWTSGVYLAEIVPQETPGEERFAFFAVRESAPGATSKILLVLSTNTWQAYNHWGGKSIYVSTLPEDDDRSNVVSFERPFERDTNQTPGVSSMYRLPRDFIRWLSVEGIAVEVATDADVHEIPDLLDRYHEVVVVASGEYYSKEIFDALQRFRDEGGSIAFFSATNIHWAVRYEANGSKLIAYKSRCSQDPYWGVDPSRVTCRWDMEKMGRASESLAGGTYVKKSPSAVHSPCIVSDSRHWIFDGTGLRDGDPIGLTLCGGELDYVTEHSPPSLSVLMRDTLPHKSDPNHPGFLHEATFYEVRKGDGFDNNNKGRVFDAATVRWVVGLGEDANVGVITRNVLEAFAVREGKITCADGKDSDEDGLVDLEDPGCWGPDDPSEHDGALPCDDGLDNDGDGSADLADPVCTAPTDARETSQCQDGLDNDNDGRIDFDGGASHNGGVAVTEPDSLCVTALSTAERRACGVGFELVLLAPLVQRKKRRLRVARS